MEKRARILVGHTLTNEGVAFVCTPQGTAREFESVEDAQKWIESLRASDKKIWTVYVLAEVVPAAWTRNGA